MKKQKLRIGFDLDGVLLYNPARIFRPITLALKTILPKKTNGIIHFYYPKSPPEELLWKIVHWSSIFAAKGISDIEDLVKKGAIETYIISSRYNCLQSDFNCWLKKLNAHTYFKGTYHNTKDLQPHVFKEKKIKELQLDYFVEDNWNIVQHVNKTSQTKVIWITNLFDKNIPYDLKFLSLHEAMQFIRKKSNES